jgi:3'-phosphoadenosine 5'-phosphosulfate sulfotransferase (PAPS reductase)/FAD synthetase
MMICTRCVLPGTFPGIRFDEQGVCNFCRDFKGQAALNEEKKEYLDKFLKLVDQVRGRAEYDCTLSYSGGKDSTYTLYLLKEEFGLRPLTVTFDNGFVSEQAFRNIRTVTENLGVDGLIFKADAGLLKRIFAAGVEATLYSPKALERASTICTSCIGLVKFTALKIALEKRIPLMAWGWSPGQAPLRSSIMKINPALFRSTQEMYRQPMREVVGEAIDRYFLSEEHFQQAGIFPTNVSPLAFLEYDERRIVRKIEELGWAMPQGLDANSTNCLLNAFANQVHIDRHGFHPYAFEVAGMVRTGVMSREDGMEKIYGSSAGAGLIAAAKEKLGLPGAPPSRFL